MRRSLFSLLMITCLAAQGWAEGPAKGSKPQPGTTVEMPFLIAPMSQDGRLLGYAYISSKLMCASPAACIAVREKLAFIQDAYVRDVNALPISLSSDSTAVDRDLLNARLTAKAKRIVGDNKVKNMVFLQIQYMPLHPSDSTAGLTTPPQEAAAGTAVAPVAPAATSAPGTAAQSTATSKPPASPAH